MSLQSESSGRANGFVVSAGRVTRSSSSQFGTSWWGRGLHSLGSGRSLWAARCLGVVARRGCISLGGERPSASFKVARGAVTLRAQPDSPSANQPQQLRLRPEIGRFGGLVAASRPVALVSRVRERVSSASSFARSARHKLQSPCIRCGFSAQQARQVRALRAPDSQKRSAFARGLRVALAGMKRRATWNLRT
jgi:hypothetical protein